MFAFGVLGWVALLECLLNFWVLSLMVPGLTYRGTLLWICFGVFGFCACFVGDFNLVCVG